MVGLDNRQPVRAPLCYKSVSPVRANEVEQESRSDAESESERSSGISSIDGGSTTVDGGRKCYVAIQAVVSADFKDEESVHLKGRESLGDVICVTIKNTMKIDETVEVLTPSSGNLPSNSSEVNQEAVCDEGHCNGKTEDKKETDSTPENGSEDEADLLVPTVDNWPTDNEVVDRLLVANKSQVSPGGIVKELVNVLGYENDVSPWGSAVEVANQDFYPTALTCPLKDDEYLEFLDESGNAKSRSESQEFKTCLESGSGNTTLEQVDELQHDDEVLKFVSSTENVSNVQTITDLEEKAPELYVTNFVDVECEEIPPESISNELAVVDPDKIPPESKSNDVSIVDAEENPPEIILNEPIVADPVEKLPEVKVNEFVALHPEENSLESKSSELVIADPEENLPEPECNSNELAIVDPEENLPECNPSELGTTATHEDNPPAKDSCDTTNPVEPEVGGDALSLEDITDDFILDVFIKDVEGDPMLNQFENATELAFPVNEDLDVADDIELRETEQTAEASRCHNLDTKIDTVQGDEEDSTSCVVSTNEEQSEHASVQDVQVAETEKDEMPAENSSSVSSSRGSVRDPRLRPRTRSFEESASQVSVASTSSSHSSLRPCSVVLTRLDDTPSAGPVGAQSRTEPVNLASPSGKSNSIDTGEGESMENDQAKGEPELDDGCDEKNEKLTLAAPISCEDVAELIPSDEEDVNMDDEPIRIYEPINLDDSSDPAAIEDEAKTEVIMEAEAAPDASSEPVRSTRKRKSSAKAKAAEVEVKKARSNSTKRESTENPEKSVSSMSKREVIAYIKKEAKKPQPDFIKLREAMNLTYDSTRKAMYDNGQVDVEIIKKKHPELLHYQMVKGELGRILKDPTKMVRLERELEEVLYSALEGKKKTLPSKNKKRHPLWQKTIKLWGENKGSENSAQYQRVLGMLSVCFEFCENAVVNKLCTILKQNGTLSEKDTDKMDTPTIVVKESDIFSVVDEADIWIYVDGEKYIKVPNMYEAVLSVFAAYYIFNISYDKSLKTLFEFFDYLCDNRQSTYKSATKKWPPELRIGVKEFPVLSP